MTPALARAFVEAVVARDFEAAAAILDPDVETITPRGTVRGITACRQVLQKARGDDHYALEQAEPDFDELDGASSPGPARSHAGVNPARSRSSATSVRLTFAGEKIVRIVVLPGGAPQACGYGFRGGVWGQGTLSLALAGQWDQPPWQPVCELL